jgi:diguanylate cyclase (GGDEF)-like protein
MDVFWCRRRFSTGDGRLLPSDAARRADWQGRRTGLPPGRRLDTHRTTNTGEEAFVSSRRMLTVLALFRPAAALVGRLRYAQKFVVVGLVLLVPLGFVATAYVDLQRNQIAFSAKERSGVELIAPLLVLTSQVVEARHLAVTPGADGNLDLTSDVSRVDSVDRRLGALLNTTNAWRAARSLVLAAERSNGSTEERYAQYNSAADALIGLIVRAGDESNLTLDPELDTYYLMDALQFRLPVLLDTAGRSIDRATVANIARPGEDANVFIELGIASGVLSSTRTVIARGVTTVSTKTASSSVRRTTIEHFTRLDAATATLGSSLATMVKNHVVNHDGHAAAARAVRREATNFAAVTATSLDTLLRTRIDGFSARAQRVEIGAGLAALLAIYLFVGFYLSMAGPIRRIVAALHAVADGDLTQRVSVETQDELSYVARALNDTVAKTEIATARLAEQATHDTLTGLPNRAFVLDLLEQGLVRARETGKVMATLFIDLDRFKIINDSLGHEAGDQVLSAVASRLRELGPDGGTVGRLAGDEFVVVINDVTELADAVRLGERIVETLSRPITMVSDLGEREATVGASIGVAFSDGSTMVEPADVLRDADVAMYRAKQRGRGRVEVFDEALRVAVERRLELQDELRRGIHAGDLRVHYQPIIDTAAAAVIGFEALVRWQHPTRGLLGAAEFIEVAEDSGLIIPLGAEVLAEACRQTALWRAKRPGCENLHIAINVSGTQFSHPSFVPTIAAVIAGTGLDPDALWLEITETSIMADAETARDTLAAVRALGVHLAIDDFGTGYSSLAYLRRFPVEVLKVDRTFVAGLGQDREDEAIVAMIISLARTLDLLLVAEGVETAEQLEQLQRLGCSTVQGYFHGRPVAAEYAWDAPAQHGFGEPSDPTADLALRADPARTW